MVNAQQDYETTYVQEIRHITIPVAEVFETKGNRFGASVYCTEGRTTKQLIQQHSRNIKPLAGINGFVSAYHRPRFKRVFVEKSNLPIYQPSQISDVYPKPELFISDKTDTKIEQLRVHKGQILVTCSGTVGKTSFASDTLDNKIFSHDLLRLDPIEHEDAGFVYAFLSSKYGQTLLTTNNYGAVVQHIEPFHLAEVKIPNPPQSIKAKINKLILDSFKLRDESNDLINKAERILVQELRLPPLYELPQRVFKDNTDVTTYAVPASKLNNRLDASYHVPIVDSIVKHISEHSKTITNLGGPLVSSKIFLPGRFKRVYVEESQGTKFIGSKQIGELNPVNTKYLSLSKHKSKLQELELKENMILVSRSGTIGNVKIVPKHWESWVINEHVLRIVPASNENAGYIYAWLDTEYGQALIRKNTFGAVVDEIDEKQLSEVPIPLVEEGKQHQINSLILTANKKRYEAYLLEQEAISLINSQILN